MKKGEDAGGFISGFDSLVDSLAAKDPPQILPDIYLLQRLGAALPKPYKEIKKNVMLGEYSTIEDLTKAILKEETVLRNRSAFGLGSDDENSDTEALAAAAPKISKSKKKREAKKKKKATAKEIEAQGTQAQAQAAHGGKGGKGKGGKDKNNANRQCYRCWEWGHVAQNCPATAPVEASSSSANYGGSSWAPNGGWGKGKHSSYPSSKGSHYHGGKGKKGGWGSKGSYGARAWAAEAWDDDFSNNGDYADDLWDSTQWGTFSFMYWIFWTSFELVCVLRILRSYLNLNVRVTLARKISHLYHYLYSILRRLWKFALSNYELKTAILILSVNAFTFFMWNFNLHCSDLLFLWLVLQFAVMGSSHRSHICSKGFIESLFGKFFCFDWPRFLLRGQKRKHPNLLANSFALIGRDFGSGVERDTKLRAKVDLRLQELSSVDSGLRIVHDSGATRNLLCATTSPLLPSRI